MRDSMTAPSTNPFLRTTRRHFFRDCGVGVGKIALASLLAKSATTHAAAPALKPRSPHFAVPVTS